MGYALELRLVNIYFTQMKQIFCFFIVFCLFATTKAQEEVAVLEHRFKQPYGNKTSYSVIDEQENQIWIIAENKNRFVFTNLDTNFKERKKLILKSLKGGINVYQGHHISKDFVHFYFSNEYYTKIGVLKIDKKNFTVQREQIDFKIKKEKVIQSIVNDNSLLIITVGKKSSEISLHKFKDNLNFSTTKFQFPNIGKNRPGEKTITISRLLSDSKWLTVPTIGGLRKNNNVDNPVQQIDTDLPIPINIASEKTKIYIAKDFLHFSFDNDPDFTQIVSINLKNNSINQNEFKKPTIIGKSKSYNSFFNGKIMLQIVANEDNMILVLKDYESHKILNEFKIDKNFDEIPFKSTPILLEGGHNAFTENREKEITKTSSFLRKINDNNIGVSLYKFQNDNYNLTIGGYDTRVLTQSASLPLIGPVGAIGGVIAGASLSLNIYSSTTYSKSSFFSSYLDQDYNFKKDSTLPKHAFELIETYEERLTGKERAAKNKYYFGKVIIPNLKNIFKFKGNYYYCYVDSKKGDYKIMKFEE